MGLHCGVCEKEKNDRSMDWFAVGPRACAFELLAKIRFIDTFANHFLSEIQTRLISPGEVDFLLLLKCIAQHLHRLEAL